MPLAPGDRFGRYELAELLGKGGMGEVYSAYDTLLHRSVALKVLTSQPGSTLGIGRGGGSAPVTDGAARILREARAAAGLTHPNAVPIFDVGEVGGVSFLAMELVAGRTLRVFVGDPGVPIPRRIRWLADVARALGAAHSLGLVHRDIKPENVMVRDDGVVKVLDFGIARRAMKAGEGAVGDKVDPELVAQHMSDFGTLTAEGVVVGTPMYMAPEQMRGEPLDGRVDQFAWAVVAHELLTGKLPWTGTGVEVVRQIMSAEVTPLTEKSREIPARVDSVIRVALRKERGERFATMEEIAEELEPYAAAMGVTTGRTAVHRSLPVSSPAALAPTEQIPSFVPPASPPGSVSTRTQLVTGPTEVQSAASMRSAGGPASVAGRGGRTKALIAGGALLAIGATALLSRVSAKHDVVHGAADAGATAEAVTQMSANAGATAAYHAGMQAMRDASMGAAMKQLSRAIELDPLFAAAHLRRAVLWIAGDQGITPSFTQDLQAARDARANLGDHDRLVLGAFEPWTVVPPDYKESLRRLQEAEQKNPADADLAFCEGLVPDDDSSPGASKVAFDRAVAHDPLFALAWRKAGDQHALAGDEPGALAAYAKCLAVSPTATSCVAAQDTLLLNEGKCGELLSGARRLVALAPDLPGGYEDLAQGLFGSGQPLDAARAALQQRWDRTPASSRSAVQTLDEAVVAVVTGNFAGAERDYAIVEKETASDPNEDTHFGVAYPRVLLDLETGASARATRIADEYLRRRTAWETMTASDGSMWMLAAELDAHGIDEATFERRRAQWLERNPDVPTGTRWVQAYAFSVRTPEAAARALAAMPAITPLVGAADMTPDYAEAIGRTYQLAGRLDEAIPLLTQASQACAALDRHFAVLTTWAAYELGQALEARGGDAAGACAAYGRVLQRWGTAKPRSATAVKAERRRAELKCSD